MKRKIIVLGLIISFFSLLTAGTLAFFTAEEKAVNVITSGNIDIQLLETTDQIDEVGNPVPFEDISGVMPGTSVSKIAQVKNSGGAGVYVRVKVDLTIKLDDEKEEDVTGTRMISIDFNMEEWTLGEDEYYYYNDVLKPGQATKPLFRKVTFAETMGNRYQNSRAVVEIKVYAVQSDNNGTTVFEAQGWSEEIISEN